MIGVTGSTGTVGGAVVAALSAKGVPFRAIVRERDRAAAKLGVGVATVRGDLADPSSLDAALGDVTALFLLTAGGPGTVDQTRTAVDAAVRNGVTHLVRLSAVGASHDAPFQIGRWHAAAEDAVKNSGIGWTVLRPDSFMQNMLASAPTIRERGEFYSARGEGARALIDARDIGAAAAEVLVAPRGHVGATHELTGSEALTDAQLAEHFSEALGRPVRYVPVPLEAARDGMSAAGLPDWLVADLLKLDEFAARGLLGGVDPTLGELLGRPPLTFARFVRDYAEAFGG